MRSCHVITHFRLVSDGADMTLAGKHDAFLLLCLEYA